MWSTKPIIVRNVTGPFLQIHTFKYSKKIGYCLLFRGEEINVRYTTDFLVPLNQRKKFIW